MTGALRVALDVTPLAGAPTGIHHVTRGLLDALVKRDDIEVTGWLLSARGRRPELAVDIRRSPLPAGLVHRLWGRQRFPSGRLVAGPADVVHGTNFVAPPGPRSLISVQDLSPLLHPEWCRPEVRAMAAPLRHAIRRGAWIHASSQAMADALPAATGVDPARVVLVHHAVEPIGPAEPGLGSALAAGRPYVLVLGTVETRKSVDTVTNAVDALPADVRVIVAGPEGNAEHTLPRDHPRVIRLPRVDSRTRAALIRDAAVLAYPSRYEGFGLPPLEAIGAGTPVVATAVGALPELIGDVTALVPSGQPEAFVAALVAALESPGVPSDALRSRIAAMQWDRAAAEMVALYRRVADQTEGDPASR